MAAMATGSDAIALTGNSTAHAPDFAAYNETLFDHVPTSDIDMELDLVNAFDLDTDHVDPGPDLDPETDEISFSHAAYRSTTSSLCQRLKVPPNDLYNDLDPEMALFLPFNLKR